MLNPAAVEEVVSIKPSGAIRFRVMATSFLALFAVVGLPLYGLPFFYDFMVTDFGWSRTLVTSGNGVSKVLIGVFFGFVAGWAVDKFGPKKLMIGGILMAGAALIGLGRMNSLWMFYFFYMFNALGYVCGGPLPNQVLLSQWFTKSRGKAMGVAYLGIGLGGALILLASPWLVAKVGWHSALEAIGVLIVVVALPLALTVKSPMSVSGQATSEEPPPIKLVLKNVNFYLLAIGSMCSIGAIGGTNQHLKLFLALDHGSSQWEAARIASMVLWSSLVGRLLMGWLADRVPKKYVMLLIYCMVALSIPLLFVSSHPLALNLFAIAFGISLGGDYMIIPLMGAELFGVRVLGRLMGIVLTADSVAEAVCPMLVGYLRDHTGTYSVGFVTLIGMAAVGAGAVAFLKRGRAIPEPGAPKHI